MGAFVSFFFSGFILGKVPFPLSPSFRIMLQVCPFQFFEALEAFSPQPDCILLTSFILLFERSETHQTLFAFHLLACLELSAAAQECSKYIWPWSVWHPAPSLSRVVLQRGVDLPSLDVTYFTSLSYYILLLFGLRGVFMLFFRDEVIDETQMMRQQMAGGMGGNPMGNPDPQKAFEAERSAFDVVSCLLSSACCPPGCAEPSFPGLQYAS